MGWASRYIQQLHQGEVVTFRPRGSSMTPIVRDGQEVTCAPATVDSVKVGDVVLCRVGRSEYLHLVRAMRDGRAQIANARGHVNGWTSHVFGVVTKIGEPAR